MQKLLEVAPSPLNELHRATYLLKNIAIAIAASHQFAHLFQPLCPSLTVSGDLLKFKMNLNMLMTSTAKHANARVQNIKHGSMKFGLVQITKHSRPCMLCISTCFVSQHVCNNVNAQPATRTRTGEKKNSCLKQRNEMELTSGKMDNCI